MSLIHELRNYLTPIYSLADMVTDLNDNPDLLPIVIKNGEKCKEFKSKIDLILNKLNELEKCQK